jgi:hypothetical protein
VWTSPPDRLTAGRRGKSSTRLSSLLSANKLPSAGELYES